MKGFGEKDKSKKQKERNKYSQISNNKILNQAIKFHSQGNNLEAANLYQCCIDKGFNNPIVFLNYGIILKGFGNLQEAEIYTLKAIELKSDFVEAYSNLGTIYSALGKSKKAEICYLKAIELKPSFVEAHYNLGNILKDIGKSKEAAIAYQKAIELKPDSANAHSNLGNVLRDLGNLLEAEIHTRKAIELKPDFAEAYSNLGNILKDLGKSKESLFYLQKAIILKPDYAEAYLNLGSTLIETDKLKEAEIYTLKAIQLKPNNARSYYNLGLIMKDQGKYKEAIKYCRKAVDLDNKLSLAKAELIICKGIVCDWSDQDIQKKWLNTIGIDGNSVPPFGLLPYIDNPLNHLKRSQKFYKEKYHRPSIPLVSSTKQKIHIGYFSADFNDHPVMHLIASLLELHDKSLFKIFLYSFGERDDEYTNRAKNCGCTFREINKLNEIEAVQLARSDNIDIAIDLMGYTKHNRFSIFSYRVAPIQINYLGYPGSLGANKIDYIIADNVVIPYASEKFYSEKIIRMPNCYLCTYDKLEISKEPFLRENFNLPKNSFVFTCFNGMKKITPNEFDIWMRLLTKTKGSVLWLKDSNKNSISNLRREAENRKVDKNRLIFASNAELKNHLARHSLGDLALDTFAFNGCTTSLHALWAGLPILTKRGESFSARFTASILSVLGIPELITYSESEYEDTALRLANNPNELYELKYKLGKQRTKSLLFNTKIFTNDLEKIYKDLIKIHLKC